MQALFVVLCAVAFAGQADAPAVKPEWLTDIEAVAAEASGAPLGSLDARAEAAWAAAVADPKWPELHMAAQTLAFFYDSQGYELKAERVLRQALAAVPAVRVEMRERLQWQMFQHFENAQQLAKAAALMEELSKGGRSLPGGRTALARVYERMGELEKAEALWKQSPADVVGQAGNGPHAPISYFGPSWSDPEISARNEIAAFYARHGRAADAERVYQQVLSESADRGISAWMAATEGYVGFLLQQRKPDEALQLQRGLVTKLERSSDAEAPRALFGARERLAGLLAQTGHADEALAMRRGMAEQARERSESAPALAALAQDLINANRLTEAEVEIEKMRALGRSDARGGRFHELMAAQMLARVRELQNKPDEARRLRESVGVPDITNPKRRQPEDDLAGIAYQKGVQGDLDGAAAYGGRALARARDHVRTNPQELAGLMSLAQTLIDNRPAEAKRIALEALRALDSAPDHPRVAEALGSVVVPLCGLGLTGEAARAIERQERILLAAKGPDSPAMNGVGFGRVALLQRESNWAGVIEERRRMLARVEGASGPRSVDSLYALREVAWAYSYSPVDDWAEERRVLETLMERTARLRVGATDVANLYEHMANRAIHHRQLDMALAWAERGLEEARAVPDGEVYVQNMIRLRDRIRSMMPPR